MDLDNQWSYMKTHGNTAWESFPSYFDIFIPYVLDLLDRYELKITFFIVGQDAALDKNNEVLRMLTERGHEVGNHSFNHESWFHLYSRDRIESEIVKAEEHIIRVTGEKPIGFRGPGFTWSPELLKVLVENDYTYDASSFPTYLGPLARKYYFWSSDLSEEEKEELKGLYGSFQDGLRPVKSYFWDLGDDQKLLEIPVTTIPIIKTPFHLSYLLYLAGFSQTLMSIYLDSAIFFCRITGTTPSFLLHPLDLLGGEQVSELGFFPGMNLNKEQKLNIFTKVIKHLSRHFNIVGMRTHAKLMLDNANLKLIAF